MLQKLNSIIQVSNIERVYIYPFLVMAYQPS